MQKYKNPKCNDTNLIFSSPASSLAVAGGIPQHRSQGQLLTKGCCHKDHSDDALP